MSEDQAGPQGQAPSTPPPLSRKTMPPPIGRDNHRGVLTRLDPDRYRFPNEQDVLYPTLIILALVIIAVSFSTMGAVALVVAVGIVYLAIRERNFLGNCVAVTDRQFPDVHRLALKAARRLGMNKPPVYIQQSPVLNAFAMGFFTFHPFVVIHSALVEALDEDELMNIIGHEFSHIKCGHTTWTILMGDAPYRIPFLSSVFHYALLWWSRKAEYTCDRGGLLVSRDMNAAIAAQAKLAVGAQLYEQMELSEFLEQERTLNASMLGKISEAMGTHPFSVNRIRKLMVFAESEQYKRITAEIP